MVELGYWGLFLASFLAATVIPFSSEAILSGMILAGANPLGALLVATLGNWLGGMSSYGIGRMGSIERVTRWLRVKPHQVHRMSELINGRFVWASLLCWMPVFGDVIAVTLGLFRANVWITSMGMFVGKALRYVVWAWFTLEAMQWFA